MFWTFKLFQKWCFGYSCFVQCPEGQDGGVYGGGPPFIRWKAAIIAWAQPIRRSGKFCQCPPLIYIHIILPWRWKTTGTFCPADVAGIATLAVLEENVEDFISLWTVWPGISRWFLGPGLIYLQSQLSSWTSRVGEGASIALEKCC